MKDRDPRVEGEIKDKLFDLINTDKVQVLTDSFCEAVGIASAIIDLEGTVLTSSRWQKICTDFHRVNPQTRLRCIESDTVLANEVIKGQKYAIYNCRNGLIDAATPIVIEEEHIANFFIGQFLFEPPDVGYFRKLAREFGFDETSYLEALSKVPIIPKGQIKPILDFFSDFAELLGEMGLKQIKQLEVTEALRESEIRFRTLVEHLPAITYTAALDESSTTLYVSPQIEKTLGISPEEYKTDPDFWVNHLHAEDRERVLGEFGHAHKTGQPLFTEYRMISTDGRIVWLRDEAVIIKDDKGDPLYVQGVMFDITGQKKAEEALRESEKKLSQAVEGNSIPTFIIDKNHIVTHWNKACENLTGVPISEMIGTKKHWSPFYSEERPVMADLLVDKLSEKDISKYYGGKYHKSAFIEGAYEAEDFFPNLGE
ncbi:MAG: PocR ligand-binding domain-containing protein, partial [Desulfobacteraceae bacterium]|nr:PocR ligand-binding domain-containing protein [Desulfobacteraceae bacterium]